METPLNGTKKRLVYYNVSKRNIVKTFCLLSSVIWKNIG